MRKLAALLSIACMTGATGIAQAAPVGHSTALTTSATAPVQAGNLSLLRNYTQEGLVLQDNVQTSTLTIQADPAVLHARKAGAENPYRLTLKDVLSAAATYAYLYFGQHPASETLHVVADISSDGYTPVTATVETPAETGPAMTLDIARPAFPISPDTKPDAYSAQTIGMILDNIDIAKVHMQPWLRTALKDHPATP
ncbi:hypothetical protein [Acetobacter vaccinii]|uniref:Uncharacterized protein n=1 Tax=Acetobacter vaccinii TaxID=2592655 RepID=A0A5C1YRX7_9PROT|nr:hypothetical protein [Acetobacter vaccinii]QEO17880.1 hypothetical protein FLP30_09155 [Acetobacter vaccinii]